MKYTQVNRFGAITHRAFTEDPNFQPEEGSRILPDPNLKSNTTHMAFLVVPVPEDATEIQYQIVEKSQEQIQDFTPEQKESEVRRKRMWYLLTKVDTMNPIIWETLNQEEKQSWIDYRQALLDIPNQPGFPDVIDWPVDPMTLPNKKPVEEILKWATSEEGLSDYELGYSSRDSINI